MNWIGALIGAAIGWWVGGPIGLAVGMLLGQSLSVGVSRGGWSGHDAAVAQASFFNATFTVMGHVAKVDGVVSEDEIRAARAVMAHMNLSAAQQQSAMELFNRGKQPEFNLEAVLQDLRKACHARRDLLRMFLQIQLHAALADGVFHPAERQVFTRICAVLGISEIELRQYEQFIRAQQGFRGTETREAKVDTLTAAYLTLGVAASATDAEVKTAYRRLMKENHPDKLVSRGLPEPMLKLAQEKVQQINVAYDAIKSSRGIH